MTVGDVAGAGGVESREQLRSVMNIVSCGIYTQHVRCDCVRKLGLTREGKVTRRCEPKLVHRLSSVD